MMNGEISNYTISVYELIENGFDFGLDQYEIFDEKYRTTLNKAILDFYMFREIGYVNPAVWRQRLQNRMDIIMRNKYNAMYKAKLQEFNPLYTMELYETYTHNIDNNGNTKSNGETTTNNNISAKTTEKDTNNEVATNETLSLSSAFPSDEMTEDDLSSNLYVDSAQKNKGSSTNNNTNNTTTESSTDDVAQQASNNTIDSSNKMNESYSKKTIGSASDLTFAHAMTQFKDYVMQFNIDQMIIDELKDLFITLWE
jgi:hypothetical protein